MKISVLIPAYNAAATIAETLESVLGQSRPADEVIVVDDGSTDDTGAVVKACSSDIHLISKPQSGPAASLNLAMKNASGDYFAFIDADDLWVKEKLEKQSLFLRRNPGARAVLGYHESFLCPSVPPEQSGRFVVPRGAQPGWLTGTLLVDAAVFDQVGRFSEDLTNGFAIDWFDRARGAGIEFSMLTETLLRRRIRSGSLGGRNTRSDAAMLEMARRAIQRRRQQGS
jgi:glycosyltransferase involved in cell wall biosynthesis